MDIKEYKRTFEDMTTTDIFKVMEAGLQEISRQVKLSNEGHIQQAKKLIAGLDSLIQK